jgi:hypothetical protein
MFTPEYLWPIGVVLLLGALIWGVLHNRGRNRANDKLTEAATRAEYDRPNDYDKERRELEREVRPS